MVSFAWKKWEWNIISTKTKNTNKDLSSQSCPHGLECSNVSNFCCFWPLGSCVWGPNWDPKVIIMALLWKLWWWNIISTRTHDTNKNQSDKSCPHGLKSSSFSNFFLCFATWFMCLRVESITESYLSGFIDMKTMGMKH